jgi:threonyl-tRNA synthetase
MRFLQLHSDFIEYEPIVKEIKEFAEENVSKSKIRLEDLVVTLVTIEEGDNEKLARLAVNIIKKYMETVKSRKLIIYPYSHLSSNLASPIVAFELLKSIERIAKESIEHVHRAPFGWTKALTIKVKGHPLAENFKVITELDSSSNLHPIGSDSTGVPSDTRADHEEKISSAIGAEERLQSQWYVLQVDGEMIPSDKYQFRRGEENLRLLANYEIAKRRSSDEAPPHVRLMKKMAIADYEPASDVGNIRFYPKGRLMKSLIEQYITRQVMEYGGMEVETPLMYDSKHPAMESYFNRFPARQYKIITYNNKEFFLSFAACFGQFLMANDFQISYKHLPLRLYELPRYSFRREKSGELVGLRRLRAFSMPDCHALCKNMDQAKEEFLKRFRLSVRVIEALGLSTTDDVEMAIRFTEDFYKENVAFVNELVKMFGRPVLVELWKDRFFYFTLKWEFNYIDNLGKASALSTDQIDVENGQRYQIEFIDEDGSKKNPIILHNSPSGAVERVIYALLEKCAKISKLGSKPSLPLWINHTQVRIIPVGEHHIPFCEKMATYLSNRQIRADIDDRQESVSKKIRESEIEWIRYTLVIGDKETNEEGLAVRDRIEGTHRKVTLEDLANEIQVQTKDKPYLPLNLPRNLSQRPQIMI